MKFRCPACSQKLEIATIHAGRVVPCPRCSEDIALPSAEKPPPEASPASTYMVDLTREQAARIQQTVRSQIERGSMTISQFMASKELEGGIDLENVDATPASDTLTTEQRRKYKIGEVVTSGGMGAILDAKDTNLRRDVAMKVLLDPKEATKEDILRFIEEAQVTSQLEHPSIVPIHELGVDGSGSVFYTMKFIHGVTLEEVLRRIREGDEETIREYPLNRLLNVFQRVCDAMAFAHSKRVIHRDLKPENIMIGEYGEVQVMDWGIAKVLPPKKRKTKRVAAKRPRTRKSLKAVVSRPTVESLRDDPAAVSADDAGILKTMAGAIMGTPGYMAPEQALGKTGNLDERTDIYALGAILYSILTLHPPVTGDDVDKVLQKVTRGRIAHPSRYNPPGGRRRKTEDAPRKKTGQPGEIPLDHCPNKTIPDSLSAVAMQALSLKQTDRYQSVTTLQNDIEAYQHGFATSAEHAGVGKQLGLLLKRHKGVSIAVGAALTIVISLASWSYMNIVREKNETQKALDSLRKTAPTFHAQARALIKEREFEQALKNIDFAISLRPREAKYHALKGNILQSLLRMKEAWESYWRTLKCDPDFPHAKENKALCAKIYTANKGRDKLMPASLAELQQAMRDQGRDWEVIAAAGTLRKGSGALEATLRNMLREAGVRYEKLVCGDDGSAVLTLGQTEIADLSPLSGMPLTGLHISSPNVTDISPLKGLPLTSLSLTRCCRLTDLAPLRGMRLKSLVIDNSSGDGPWIKDITPLRGMPLEKLRLGGTRVSDLGPLNGMKLKSLSFWISHGNNPGNPSICDLTPLEGMPLESLNLYRCYGVADLLPLNGMPLRFLNLSGCRTVNDLTPLRGMPLRSLSLGGCVLVSDLSPLRNVFLSSLDLGGCRSITDLSPLRGKPFAGLNLAGCVGVSSLAPLASMRLTWLNLDGCVKITDIRPLRGMALNSLVLQGCSKLTDIDPLRGMPLTSLSLANTGVMDIRVLQDMHLKELDLSGTRIRDVSPLKDMRTLSGMGRYFKGTAVLAGPAIQSMIAGDYGKAERQIQTVVTEWSDVPAMKGAVDTMETMLPTIRELRDRPGSIPTCAQVFKGHHYVLWRCPMTWPQADRLCKSMGAHLLAISSDLEQAWVRRLPGMAQRSIWLGAYDEQGDAKWKWVNGEPWGYSCAAKDASRANQQLKALLLPANSGTWVRQNEDYQFSFIIEWDH